LLLIRVRALPARKEEERPINIEGDDEHEKEEGVELQARD
jgi:hypothetical protein